MRKKLLFVLSIFAMMLFLASCDGGTPVNDETLLNAVIGLVDVNYEPGDSKDHVTQNVSFVTGELQGATLSWSSNNEDSIKIDGSVGIVTRADSDVTVTLTATLTYNEKEKTKSFELIVIKKDKQPEENTDDALVDKALATLSIGYATGDAQNQVTQNVSLVNGDLQGATLVWTSNNDDSIKIDGSVGIVTRTGSDVTVTLTATLTLNDVVKVKTFDLVVSKVEEQQNPDPDGKAPLIFGLDNYVLYVDDSKPDWLANVSAVDNVNESVVVTCDDSQVDLSKAGSYDITYTAKDSANNQTNIKMTVIVMEASSGDSYTETFDQLGLSGSSYTSGEFTGVNGVKWTFSGARGDLMLNGAALAFGGKITDDSFLSATIDGGISSLSLNFDKPFTNGQTYDVYINGNVIGSFDNSNGSGNFSLDSINITGQFELSIKPQAAEDGRKQCTIDDLTWTGFGGSDDQGLSTLVKDFKGLTLPKTIYTNTQLNLVSSGAEGSLITWSVNDAAKAYIDLSSGQVTVPTEGQIQIVLKALLTNGTASIAKSFVISIGKTEMMTIAQALTLSQDEYVYTQGVISACYETNQGLVAFLQDGNQAIRISLDSKFTSSIVVGNKVKVEGYINNHEIYNVSNVEFVSVGIINGTQVTANQLSAYMNKLVEVSGYLELSYPSSYTSYVLKTLNGDIIIGLPKGYSNTSIQTLLSGKTAGTKVELTSIVYKDGDSYGVYLISLDGIVLSDEIVQSELDEITLANVSSFNLPQSTSSDIVLPDGSNLLFGASISWVSNQPSVINNNGEIQAIEEDSQVVLSYIIYNKEGVSISSGQFEVNALAANTSYTGTYYNSINTNLSGDNLKAELRALISNMDDRGYDYAKTVLAHSDEDPNNPSNILLVYNRASIYGPYDGSSWNREHIWPQSKLGSASKSDMFNLRPSNISINSSRSNYPYGDKRSNNSQGYGYYGGYWYPGDDDRGDIARAVLYMNTRWGLSISSSVIGSLDTFLLWNELDPVDEFEMHRNDVIETYQHNRNPYVDHPEWITTIYGNAPQYRQETQKAYDINTNLIVVIDSLNKTTLYR